MIGRLSTRRVSGGEGDPAATRICLGMSFKLCAKSSSGTE